MLDLGTGPVKLELSRPPSGVLISRGKPLAPVLARHTLPAMLSGRRIFAALALGCVAAAAGVYFKSRPDPVVDGRPASAWTFDLLSQERAVQQRAQETLLKLGERGLPQVRVLLRKRSLAWERMPFLKTLPFLRLRGVDPGFCRERGAEMLISMGATAASASAELVDSLAYSQAAANAERALLRIGASAVPALVEGLRERDAEVRLRCARLLKEYVAGHDEIVAPLIAVLGDPDLRVRRQAALSLSEARSQKERIVATLLDLSREKVAEVRAAAISSIAKLEVKSPQVLARINEGFSDLVPVVRLEAAKAHWSLTHDPTVVLPVLIGVLPTAEGWQAAYALGSLGTGAAHAVPALIEALRREKVPRAFRTPPSSSFALGQIREAAIPALEVLLQDSEPSVRLAAVLAFGYMKEHAKPAIPKLQKLLQDSDPEIRHVTALTLASAGADREVVLASLAECLKAEDIYMRSTAASLLRQISPDQNWAIAPE